VEISKVNKILGVHFTHNYSLFWKMNFETIEKSLKESLKGWNSSNQIIRYTENFIPGFSHLNLKRFP